MSQSHSNTNRTTLTKSLSEKFVWAIAYGSCVGRGAFILPVAIRFKDLKHVTNDELDYLILNKQ